MRKPDFAYAKIKVQISFTVTAKLISAFVFATWMVQFLFFLNLKFQASSLLLRLYRPVCDIPGRKPRRLVFPRCSSYQNYVKTFVLLLGLSQSCSYCIELRSEKNGRQDF